MGQTTKTKQLLVFAHRGEAQVFLNRGRFRKSGAGFKRVYENERSFLLITGEGVHSAGERLGDFCDAFHSQIDQVMNFGIAGGLSTPCQNGRIFSIRKVYREAKKRREYPALHSADKSAIVDCITATKRVLTPEYGRRLSAAAPIVDRELWGYASVCQTFGLPFFSYKLISDCIGKQVVLADISSRAGEFSRQLFECYIGLAN